MPVSLSEPNEMPGADTVPDEALSWPVMPACPSRGSDPVISVAMSEKLPFIAELLIVVPDEKLFGTLIDPLPFLGMGYPVQAVRETGLMGVSGLVL